MSTVLNTKIASDESIDYLVTLIEERTEKPVTHEQFAGKLQSEVSAMITRCLTRPALPATPEQLAQVADLAAQLGKGTLVSKDRGQASRQIRSMQADLAARAAAALSAARRVEDEQLADIALDTILNDGETEQPVTVPAPGLDGDDIPF